MSRSASTFSDSTGSSINMSLNGSSSFCEHLGHRLVHAAVEVDADADVRADRFSRTARTLSITP